MAKRVAIERGPDDPFITTVKMTEGERDEILELCRLKYRGSTGYTSVLMLEGMRAVREETTRIKTERANRRAAA